MESRGILQSDQQLLEPRKRREKREKNMDAKEAQDILENVANFGGIFSADQLQNVKILDLPVMLLVLDDGHWISIFISKSSLEIMDSAGFSTDEQSSKHLLRFLCAHSFGKKLTVTPKLQSENSSDCGKYATSFLVVRAVANLSLRKFAKIFSDDFKQNSILINDIFETITTRSF